MNPFPQNQKRQGYLSVLFAKGHDRCSSLPLLKKFMQFLRWASGLEDHLKLEDIKANRKYGYPPAKSRSLHGIALILGMMIPGLGTVHATQVVPLSLNETVRQADSIVVGTVTDKQSRWGDASRRWIVTDYTFAVEDVVFASGGLGSIGKTIKVTYWGGEIDGEGQGVSDSRLPVVKERLLLMLKPGWQKEVHFSPLVGFNQGLFQITTATAEKPAMVQDAEGASLTREQNGSITKRNAAANGGSAGSGVDLGTFVSWLRTNTPAIKAGPSELRPQASADDPRVMKTLRLPIETNDSGKQSIKGPSRSPSSGVPKAEEALPKLAPGAATDDPAKEEQKPQLQQLAGEGQVSSAYSFPRTASPPIVVNNFPDSFAPWSPEDEFQMSKWNHYANIFQVFVTPTGNWAWQNNRFDLCGWPSNADMVAQFGAGWDANTIGICYTRWFTSNNIIIEGDIALNPAFSFTLDDEWVYDGSTAQGFRQVMTHELGHMWGLDHQFNFMSVMNYMPSRFRFFGIPYMDDAEGIRAGYPGQAVTRTDLGVYLYYSSGFQSISDASYPSTVTAGQSLTVNNYHVENVGTESIGTPTIEWYLTVARNYNSPYYFLGTSTYGSLPRFFYFDPPSTSRTFTVPLDVPAGNYYLNAFIRNDSGAGQGSFPFSNDYAFSRFRIQVLVPTVTVVASDATAGEPSNSGTFTFTRSGSTAAGLTVNYSVGGTATSGSDYSAIGSSVSFAAGSSTTTRIVSPINDSTVESTESVVLSLSSGLGYNVGSPSSATISIQDDDLAVVTVAATDATAAEPGSTGVFTFTRTGPTTASLTANFTVSGTATSGTDFGSLGTTVVFAAGSATATRTVTPMDDVIVEGNETVVATVAAGAGYAVGSPSVATVTIQDNDSAGEDLLVDNSDGAAQVALVGTWTPSTSTSGYIGANYLHDGNAGKGTKSATFTPTVGIPGNYEAFIRYTAGSTRASNVPVDVIHSGGTTTVIVNQRINGGQWVSLGTYNFAVGTAGKVQIRTTGTDGYVIADAIQLVGSSLPVVTVVATDSAAAEPSATGTFTFSRSGPTTSSLTANISGSGSATSGTDYGSLGTTVVFPAGSATATKTVTPIDDAAAEGNETVVATVVAGAGYAVGSPSVATVTIEDDDAAVADLLVDNADGPSQVILVGTWGVSTSVPGYFGANYIQDLNRFKGSKSATFIPTVGTAGSYEVFIWYVADVNRASNVPVDVIHSAGTTTVIVNQRINGSQWVSLGTYNFAAGTGGQVSIRNTGTDGYVIADAIQLVAASLPSVTVAATDASAAEPNATGTFTFTRSGPTTSSLTVNINVSGSATSGTDFGSLGTTVVFAAGSATATKTVTPIDDAIVEGNETVIATAVAGPGYSIGSPSAATVTIQDNDSAAADLLVDNADGAAQVEVVGTWTASTSTSGYFGVNYLQDGNSGKGTKSVTFIPTVGTAGSYEVFIWYTAGSNRASNVPVDVIHSGGTTTVIVNQQVGGAQWISLGTYNFAAGTAGRVRIRNAGTSGYVLADAVKFQ